MIILVYDTETTGFANYDSVLQLSYVVFLNDFRPLERGGSFLESEN